MQMSFFHEESRMERITRLGDPLEKLNAIVDWRVFCRF